jgi:hypothetical protein
MYQRNPRLTTSKDETQTFAATLYWLDSPEHLDLHGILNAIYDRNGYLRQRLIRVGDLFELVIRDMADGEDDIKHRFKFWRAEHAKDEYDTDGCRECWFYCYHGRGGGVTGVPHLSFGGKSFIATVHFIKTFDEIGLMQS